MLPVSKGISPFRMNNTRSNRLVLDAIRFCCFRIHKKTDSHQWAFLRFFGGRNWGRSG